METILELILLLILLIGGCGLFFLVFVQPIWGVVDVAVSREHSGGAKAAVILLILLLLGPIMTLFYACFGTRRRMHGNFCAPSKTKSSSPRDGTPCESPGRLKPRPAESCGNPGYAGVRPP